MLVQNTRWSSLRAECNIGSQSRREGGSFQATVLTDGNRRLEQAWLEPTGTC